MLETEQEQPQFAGAIVPHLFRYHQACSTLCKHNTHLDNYCHADLLCGKVLSGYDLSVCLKDTNVPSLVSLLRKQPTSWLLLGQANIGLKETWVLQTEP